jgi:Flp pilus assembly protein TadD
LAKQLFRDALAVDPRLVEAINGLGVAAARAGDYDGAVGIWSGALTIPGGTSAVGLNLATALRRVGRAPEAANILLAYQTEARLVDASVLSMSALLLREHGAAELTAIAERCYRAAWRLEPQTALHAYRLANALLDSGAVEQSILLYRRALIIMPTLAAAENNMGNALRTLGRSQHALAAFSRAVALEPLEGSFWVNHGAALLVRPVRPK